MFFKFSTSNLKDDFCLNLKNRYDITPLHTVCKNENISIEIIKFLIENKSDLNLKNEYNLTPFDIAFQNQSLLEKLKEKHGENIYLKTFLNQFI